MLIGMESNSIDYDVRIVEPAINRDASTYIVDNYTDLIKLVKGYSIREEKANDLVHDVYISIYEDESNCEGFNMEFGLENSNNSRYEGTLMSVDQFVKGRMRLYAKNAKYRTDVIEVGNYTVIESSTHFEEEINKKGQTVLDKNGKPKGTMKVDKRKVNVQTSTMAASFNEGGDVEENNDDFQMAFATAATADSTDDITDMLSLREQIDYCIDLCSMHGFSIINVFKNVDTLADMLGEYSRRKKLSETIFSQLSNLVLTHDELAKSIIDILSYSAKHKEEFELIMATY